MALFVASAFLAGLSDGLRTAHAMSVVRVALFAPLISFAYGWLSGVQAFGPLFLGYILPGLLMGQTGAVLGLVILFKVESPARHLVG